MIGEKMPKSEDVYAEIGNVQRNDDEAHVSGGARDGERWCRDGERLDEVIKDGDGGGGGAAFCFRMGKESIGEEVDVVSAIVKVNFL